MQIPFMHMHSSKVNDHSSNPGTVASVWHLSCRLMSRCQMIISLEWSRTRQVQQKDILHTCVSQSMHQTKKVVQLYVVQPRPEVGMHRYNFFSPNTDTSTERIYQYGVPVQFQCCLFPKFKDPHQTCFKMYKNTQPTLLIYFVSDMFFAQKMPC